MIERYGRDVMRQVWTEENKFNAYLKVEILAAEAWSKLGVVPEEDVAKLNEKATFNIDRIKEIELQTRHDIVAFTRCVSESLGEERKWCITVSPLPMWLILPTATCSSRLTP